MILELLNFCELQFISAIMEYVHLWCLSGSLTLSVSLLICSIFFSHLYFGVKMSSTFTSTSFITICRVFLSCVMNYAYRLDFIELCSQDCAMSASRSGSVGLPSGYKMRLPPPYIVDKYFLRYGQCRDTQRNLVLFHGQGLTFTAGSIAHSTEHRPCINRGEHWRGSLSTAPVVHSDSLDMPFV